MRRKPHPFQDKIERGEIKLVDHLNVSEGEFQSLLAELEPPERELATRIREKGLVSA